MQGTVHMYSCLILIAALWVLLFLFYRWIKLSHREVKHFALGHMKWWSQDSDPDCPFSRMSETSVRDNHIFYYKFKLDFFFYTSSVFLSFAPYLNLDKHKSHLLWLVLKNFSIKVPPPPPKGRSFCPEEIWRPIKSHLSMKSLWSFIFNRLKITVHCGKSILPKTVTSTLYLSLRNTFPGLCSDVMIKPDFYIIHCWCRGGQMARRSWT